jgi:hypothetical protein
MGSWLKMRDAEQLAIAWQSPARYGATEQTNVVMRLRTFERRRTLRSTQVDAGNWIDTS